MAERPRRDLSDASHETTLFEGLARALSFAPSSRPTSSASHHPSDAKHGSRTTSPVPSDHPSDILRRHLSVRSAVSTTSRFAESVNLMAEGNVRDRDPNYRVIGLGSCGSVFEIPGTEMALKKGKDAEAMWNDFCLTNTVHKAINDTQDFIQSAFPQITILRTPHCSLFRLPTSTDFWPTHLPKFPASHRQPGALFQVDRILPLPQRVREALIDQYFDEDPELQQEAKKEEENKSCLIRIYLGENEEGNEEYDSLRNFPMRLNMVEELGLDKTVLADEIAIALAICHWQAQVDAMDAEFVLGSAATTRSAEKRQKCHQDEGSQEVNELDFATRSIHVWLLDFDKSSRIELTPEHVEKYLVPAFLGNDPYYPRPDVDQGLWERFGETYIKASRLVLQNKPVRGKVMELPALFLGKVEAMIKSHEGWDPEKDIVFG